MMCQIFCKHSGTHMLTQSYTASYTYNIKYQQKDCFNIICIVYLWHNAKVCQSRVAEVTGEDGWHLPKSLDSDENFKPQHTLFCRKLRFVAIYALFGDLWAKKCLFGSKTVFLGQEVHNYMVHIAYFTELSLRVRVKMTHLTQKL